MNAESIFIFISMGAVIAGFLYVNVIFPRQNVKNKEDKSEKIQKEAKK